MGVRHQGAWAEITVRARHPGACAGKLGQLGHQPAWGGREPLQLGVAGATIWQALAHMLCPASLWCL